MAYSGNFLYAPPTAEYVQASSEVEIANIQRQAGLDQLALETALENKRLDTQGQIALAEITAQRELGALQITGERDLAMRDLDYGLIYANNALNADMNIRGSEIQRDLLLGQQYTEAERQVSIENIRSNVAIAGIDAKAKKSGSRGIGGSYKGASLGIRW
jgi:hypothetical protein